jgi:hypothetical protein
MANKKTCFVIGPIGDDGSEIRLRSDRVLKYVIEPAAETCGYVALRADKISTPGIITVQVIQQVHNAPMIVADLTGSNPNAFYELAIRHMVKRPLVQMIRRGEKLPFDLAASRVLFFDDPELENVEQTRAALVEHIKAAEADPTQVDNPISVSTDLQALKQSGDPLRTQVAEMTQTISAMQAELAELRRQQTSEVFLRPINIPGNMRSGGFDVVPATPYVRFSSILGQEGGKGLGIGNVAKEWLRTHKSSSTSDEGSSKDPTK